MRNTCSHRGLVDRGVRHTGEDGGSTLFMMSVVLHDDDVDNVFVAQQADRVRVHVHSHCGLVDRRIHHNREDSGSAVVRAVFLLFVRARACVCMCVHLGHSYDVRDFSEDRASLCETIVPEQLDLYEADVVTTFSRLDSHSTSGPDGLKGRTLKNCAAQLGKIFILEI